MSQTHRRRVGAIDGKGRGVVVEDELCEPRPGEVLVEVAASLISPGTELGGVPAQRREPDESREPRPFGYANAGVVSAVGEGVAQFAPGDRVACMGAGYAQHASLALVPENLCTAVPESLSFEAASYAHLAATALHAVRRAEPLFGENAMIMGLGLVGQLAGQLAQLSGSHALGVDRYPMRLERAGAVGFEATASAANGDPVAAAAGFCGGFGMDYGIIAFGGDGTEAMKQIVASLKVTPDTHRMGRIVIVGGATITHGFAATLGNVDVRSAARTGPGYHDEGYEFGGQYPAVFVEWTTQRNLAECVRAMADGRLQVEPLTTHRLPLSQIGDAVDALVEHPESALGVVLTPD